MACRHKQRFVVSRHGLTEVPQFILTLADRHGRGDGIDPPLCAHFESAAVFLRGNPQPGGKIAAAQRPQSHGHSRRRHRQPPSRPTHAWRQHDLRKRRGTFRHQQAEGQQCRRQQGERLTKKPHTGVVHGEKGDWRLAGA